MATRPSVSHLQLNANFGPGPSTARRGQNPPSRTVPGSSSGSTVSMYPKSTRRRGFVTRTCATRHQPHQPPDRNPPLLEATKSPQMRGDRGPYSHMKGRHHCPGETLTGSSLDSNSNDFTAGGPTAQQPRRMNGHCLHLRYSVPDSVHCSRASDLPRPGLAQDPVGVALAAPIPHGPRAGQ